MSHHPSNVHANESLVVTPAATTRGLAALVPWIAGVLALGMMLAVVAKGLRPIDQGGLPIDEIARLPVSASGRTKPLDSFARASLLRLSGRQSFEADGGRQAPAIEWLLELWTNRDKAVDRRVIRIDHPEVVTLAVGKPAEARQTRFTVREILPAFPAIAKQAEQASQRPAKSRDLFERQVLELYNKLSDFSAIANFDAPYSVAPLAPGQEWKPLSLAAGPGGHGTDEASTKLMAILSSYAEGNAEAARAATREYAATLEEAVPSDAHAARSEVLFNRVEPFYQASTLYVLAFILGGVSLLMRPISPLKWSPAFARATLAVVGVAFLVHTLGLFARIYLQGRPPVTNLYSSAVFIGWACVPLAIAGEWFQRHGLLTLVASLIGFSTLVIAHNLGASGDTMEMMQAVLDSNFWLATHVVVVTIGYSATFLAGFIAVLYVLVGVPTRLLAGEPFKALPRMIYGVICFATITSFVGTVLGGIWADQSWGRFWGWDPKENGAAMIVLWNLLILHARWGGMIKDRGVAVLAIAGNIMTAWSWFGTNMLGVGLHSYGFMDSAAFYLIAFVLSQLAIMALSWVPIARWRSAPMKGAASAATPSATVVRGTFGNAGA